MKSIIKISILSIFFICSTSILFSEEASHNRIAVIDKNIWQSQIGFEYNMHPYIVGLKNSFFSFTPQGNILYKNRWYIGFSFPLFILIPLNINENMHLKYAPGNLQFAAAWINQTNQGRFQINLSTIFPTGYTNEYAFIHDTIQTTDGLNYISITGLYTYFSDPVSVDLALTTTTSLPLTTNNKIIWEPLNLLTNIGINTVVNREIAFRFDIKEGIKLPAQLDYEWAEENIQLSTICSFCVLYNKTAYSISIRLSKNFTDPLSGLNMSINYLYNFK
ncbi:MAG TPA: hypothetical protein PLB48_03065 [Treponema sp.]|nr:hypothetical protein [Treponema sp.]HRU28456.1 hypothetical protein [Treponema sp.]